MRTSHQKQFRAGGGVDPEAIMPIGTQIPGAVPYIGGWKIPTSVKLGVWAAHILIATVFVIDYAANVGKLSDYYKLTVAAPANEAARLEADEKDIGPCTRTVDGIDADGKESGINGTAARESLHEALGAPGEGTIYAQLSLAALLGAFSILLLVWGLARVLMKYENTEKGRMKKDRMTYMQHFVEILCAVLVSALLYSVYTNDSTTIGVGGAFTRAGCPGTLDDQLGKHQSNQVKAALAMFVLAFLWEDVTGLAKVTKRIRSIDDTTLLFFAWLGLVVGASSMVAGYYGEITDVAALFPVTGTCGAAGAAADARKALIEYIDDGADHLLSQESLALLVFIPGFILAGWAILRRYADWFTLKPFAGDEESEDDFDVVQMVHKALELTMGLTLSALLFSASSNDSERRGVGDAFRRSGCADPPVTEDDGDITLDTFGNHVAHYALVWAAFIAFAFSVILDDAVDVHGR